MSSKTPDPMAIEEVAIRAAMGRRIGELKANAASLADPRPWIRERPLTTCMVAAGAGIALGMLAGGRKAAAETPAASNGNGDHASANHREHQTLGVMLAGSLLPSLQPMIRDLIHNAMAGLSNITGTTDKAAEVADEAIPSGLADDNKVVD